MHASTSRRISGPAFKIPPTLPAADALDAAARAPEEADDPDDTLGELADAEASASSLAAVLCGGEDEEDETKLS